MRVWHWVLFVLGSGLLGLAWFFVLSITAWANVMDLPSVTVWIATLVLASVGTALVTRPWLLRCMDVGVLIVGPVQMLIGGLLTGFFVAGPFGSWIFLMLLPSGLFQSPEVLLFAVVYGLATWWLARLTSGKPS